MTSNKFKGHSLLSLIIALSLSSSLLLLLSQFFNQLYQKNSNETQTLQLQIEIHQVLSTMIKDIRRAGFIATNDKVLVSNFKLFKNDEFPYIANIGELKGEQAHSCILFFYDLDKNGCIGSRPTSGICMSNNQNQSNNIQSEIFGFRLNNKNIQVRSGYRTAFNQRCPQTQCQSYIQPNACNSIGWSYLLDETEYAISHLQFSWLAEKKGIFIDIEGYLLKKPHIKYQTSAVVPLLNGVESDD